MTEDKARLEKELLELLEAKEQAIKYNRLDTLYPDKGMYRRELYPKHVEFMQAGSKHSQRAFIAANRVGKTLTACTELAYHLTGRYPDWWKGKVFLNPVNCWAAGRTSQATKEGLQYTLLGEVNDMGTGTIPRDAILGSPTKKPGVPEAIETIYVKHTSGGTSKVTFKSYDQGREVFQGTYRHVILLDEEPSDMGIYSECLTRTMNATAPGIMICTFTPLFGLSDIVMSFLPDGQFPDGGIHPQQPSKFVMQVQWDDVPHIEDSQKEIMLSAYSDHEKLARSRGIPNLGSGVIYPYLEEDVTCEPFEIPIWWPRAYGIDVGWNMTAAVWGAMNPTTKEIYIYSEHFMGMGVPAIHASAIKARGDWIPGVIDPGSKGGSQADGRALFDLYLEEGLDLTIAENAVDAGIFSVGQKLASGRLKIFTTCKKLLSEYRKYRRDEKGHIVKKNDHGLDALRYFIMSGLDNLMTQPDPDYQGNTSNASPQDKDGITGY
jgi:phage terminase large subunit-like protein